MDNGRALAGPREGVSLHTEEERLGSGTTRNERNGDDEGSVLKRKMTRLLLNRVIRSAILIGTVCAMPWLVSGQTASAAASPSKPADLGWPRQYDDGTATLVVYQPQVDSWKDGRRLVARFAVALIPTKTAKTVYGAMIVEADSLVDKASRTVQVANFEVRDVRYPAAKDDAENKRWGELTARLWPKQPVSIALSRILAYLDTSQVKARQTNVSMDPPSILVSYQPSALVIIDGEPITLDIEKTNLQKIVNTNWDLFIDKKSGLHYLRDGKSWLSAKGLNEAWSPAKKMPDDFAKLPDTEPYKEVKQTAADPVPPTSVPLILVVKKPSELLVLAGEPSFVPVQGTALAWIANTDSDLFYSKADQSFYFLTSGRWFRTKDLRSSKWEAATTSLPEDFKKIPANHPRAHVLAAVPGTRAAEEAVIEASIPQTATIDRRSATAKVEYLGEPEFVEIPGTTVLYAKNSPNDILRIGDQYFLCLEGVWFLSASAKGPWEVADKIPQEIYSIPPSSPKYNVTYVEVYDATSTSVTYGYTSGYSGVTISFGVAMWGTGYYYPPYYAYGMYPYPIYWPCPYYTYGMSAWYNPATGFYGRGSAVYGPYGGYGRAAAYNPSTGGYAWGRSAWGPYGAAAQGGFYNPNTGAWGGSARATNGYQAWGTSVVGKGDQWARTASYADSRGAVGVAQGSGGGKAIAAAGSGGSGFAARTGSGDVYAGRDGNVYKRENGQWYQNSGSGSWNSVDRPGSSAQQARVDQARSSAAGMDRSSFEGRSGSGWNQGTGQQMNRDAAARDRGNVNTQRSSGYSRSGGGGGGGWASRGGGFGGRRR